MALRLLAAVFLGAAAWQCAFVTSGAGPTRSPQGYEQMGGDDVKRYEKPEGTSNLLKELTGDKKKFYAGKEDLDYRSKGYKMEEYKTERELQSKLKGGK
eukprot:s774_g15.t1